MKRQWFKTLRISALALVAGAVLSAQAQIKIEVTRSSSSAIPVAVVPFGGNAGGSADTNVAQIVNSDLNRSGKIKPVSSIPSQPTAPNQIDAAQFRSVGADYVVVGNKSIAGGNYVAEFALVDTAQGQVLLQKRVTVPTNQPRKLAHTISDLVFERLTGSKGSFTSRIAYVQDQGGVYTLIVADADGQNPNYILNSREPITSPDWSPDGRRLAYVSYESGSAGIYVQDVFSGARQRLTTFNGVNSSPAWSPDGRQIAMTLSPNGNSEIYLYDLNSGGINRVTRHNAIDSDPSWSADGSSLYFISDRDGRPAVYRASAYGGGVSRVAGPAQSVAVSPNGQIAYSAGSGSNFRMTVANANGGGTKVIGNGPADDTPSFSPDGSMLIYAVSGGNGGHLVIASTDGSMQQKLSSSTGWVKDPAWSPK